MEEGGLVVRRVIPSDNSCLFNAVGYVMEHNKQKSQELRQVIAATVLSDPTTYSEAFLGKPNDEYCRWIMHPEKWGVKFGAFADREQFWRFQFILPFCAIELAILSEYYGREIAAYDIQTTRCDLYGQGRGYGERVMLIYDGLHYDALALSPFENASEEVDQTIFLVDKTGTIGMAGKLAESLVNDAHRTRKFTDTSKFTLCCGICQKGVIGQKEAVEHAKETGHTNFQEFR